MHKLCHQCMLCINMLCAACLWFTPRGGTWKVACCESANPVTIGHVPLCCASLACQWHFVSLLGEYCCAYCLQFTKAVEAKQVAQQDAERARFVVMKADQVFCYSSRVSWCAVLCWPASFACMFVTGQVAEVVSVAFNSVA